MTPGYHSIAREDGGGVVSVVAKGVKNSLGNLILAATETGGEVLIPRSKPKLTVVDSHGNRFYFVRR